MARKRTGEIDPEQIAFVEAQVQAVMRSQGLNWNEAVDCLDRTRPNWRGYEAPKLNICRNTLSYRKAVQSFPLDAA